MGLQKPITVRSPEILAVSVKVVVADKWNKLSLWNCVTCGTHLHPLRIIQNDGMSVATTGVAGIIPQANSSDSGRQVMPNHSLLPTLTHFRKSSIPAANVASVPQRSPLRYPGGKTWLVPHIRRWLDTRGGFLVEPFAGGAIVSLTAVMEELVTCATMVELDRDVAAFWRAVMEHPTELVARIRAFSPTRESVEQIVCQDPSSTVDRGFRTLILNRTRRGGVLAAGAALVRSGENGAGVKSRWYPETLARRIEDIAQWSGRIRFFEGDGVLFMEEKCGEPGARFFIDPPYTASGGKRAGSRLYTHSNVDHARIFKALAGCESDFLMTYDCSSEIMDLVAQYNFHGAIIEMKSGHHLKIPELLITRRRVFT